MAVDGMEFIYDDDSRQLFGKKGGKEGGDSFEFGDAHTLIPPRGYIICGVSGSCGQWLDGFSVLITR
ncbi:hypothetical protein LB505_004619 [Fusarium chuoi]|nr:hypothetical protein LB505_004619 [Fusarium chuoi]